MNEYVSETVSIFFEIRNNWLQSELRQILSVAEREEIDYRFRLLSRYIDQGLLTINTAEMFMKKVLNISAFIFSFYPRFGVIV
jgi:hypothetical protein